MPGGNPGGAAGPFPMPGGNPGGAAGGNGVNAGHFQIPGLPPGVEAHVHVVNAGGAPAQQQHPPGVEGVNDGPVPDAAGGDAPNNDAGPNADEGAANNPGANGNIPFVPEGLNAFINNVLNNPGVAHQVNPALFGGAAVVGAADDADGGAGGEAPDADAEAEVEDVLEDDVVAEPGADGANDAGANENMPFMPEGLNAFLNGIMNNGGLGQQANGGNGNANDGAGADPAAAGDDGAPNEGDEENNGNGDGGAPNPNPLAFLPGLLQGIQQAVVAAGAENGGEVGVNPEGNDDDENAGDGGGGMPMPFPEGGFQIPGLPGGVQAQVFAGALPIPMGGFDGVGGINGEEEEEDEPEEMNIED
mmetsp:Transcript_2574/g.7561  ORF Transcript_2574/g.7561 Transcript_2574/m.7561 type:complete len:360 (-) Transcript_2574:199-1278(-)